MGIVSRTLENLAKTLFFRLVAVGAVVHLGLALGLYAVAELKFGGAPVAVWGKALGALGLLYGAWGLLAFFALRPVYRAWRLYRRIMNWRRFLLEDLPVVVREVGAVVRSFRETPAAEAETRVSDRPAA